jgi:hypothetical protein
VLARGFPVGVKACSTDHLCSKRRSPLNKCLGVIALCLASAAVGCGASLTEAGAGVKVIVGDPAASCVEVGSVSSYKIGPNFQEHLKNDLRNDAAAKGGNYLRIETLTSDGNASGTAYKCPAAGVPAAAAAPVSAPAP